MNSGNCLPDEAINTIVGAIVDAVRPPGGNFADTATAARQARLVRAGVSVLAATSHPAAQACADALAGYVDRLPVRSATVGKLPASVLHQAAGCINGTGSYYLLTISSVTEAAVRAAGWDTWLTAFVEADQRPTVHARTALELVVAGTHFDRALDIAAALAAPDTGTRT